jgi:hypothetical protein
MLVLLAVGLFRLAAAARPDGMASPILAARAATPRDDPPSDDWDATYYATAK